MSLKRSHIKITVFIIAGVIVMIPVWLYVLVYMGYFGKIQSKEELRDIQNYQASEIYSEDNKLLGSYSWENRSSVPFDKIPHFLIEELIATEDARFYEHNGVDVQGLFRVFFKTLLMRDKNSGGGSTIAQQLAKNLFKRQNYGVLTMPVNKMKEAIHAMRLHQVYNQDELLALYLNTVSMGEDTYGIKYSALRFFNKTPEKLSIEEGAVLIGMLKNPTIYNPRTNPENALKRRNTVINNMAERGYITKGKALKLKEVPIKLNYNKAGVYGNVAPYYLKFIEDEVVKITNTLKKNNGEKYNVYTDGLKITTTINYDMQQYASNAVNEHMAYLQRLFDKGNKNSLTSKKKSELLKKEIKKSQRYKALKAAGAEEKEIENSFSTPVKMRLFDWEGMRDVVMSPMDSVMRSLYLLHTGVYAMEPTTGDIKVWIGGNDYSYFQYDHVTSKRQIGSTFKPIVYATAIERGESPCSYYSNEQKVYKQYGNWTPGNSSGDYKGKYSMKGALVNSVNVVSVDILIRAGISNVIQTAHSMGIKSEIPRVPSIALGVANISLMEMVKAYCVFANGGKAVKVNYLEKIEDRNGKVIWRSAKPKGTRVLKSQTAYYMTEMLKGVVNEGTASRLRYTYGLKGEMAGKTGTTQSQADGWFIGYTPGLVAGVWVGAESPRVHFRSAVYGQGAAVALPIWGLFMKQCKENSSLSPYVSGHFSSYGMSPMPDCENFKEDNVFGKIRKWFSAKKVERVKKQKSNPEEKKKKKFSLFKKKGN